MTKNISSEKTAQDVLGEARVALEAERFVAARDLLAPILEADPDFAEAWLLMARVQAAAGDAAQARAAFANCRALAPQEPVVWIEEALFEAVAGRSAPVVRAARKGGLPPALVSMVGEAGTGRGIRARGVGAATKADLAALSQGAPSAVERRAIALLKARPGAVVWGLLGQARLSGGHADAAAEAFGQGLRLEPYATDLRLGRARALMAQGQVAAALVEARRAAHSAPLSATVQTAYGRVLMRGGLPDKALAVAEAALARDPAHDGALTLAAEAAMATGQPNDAVAFAERRKPRAPGREALYAAALARANRSEAALTAYDAILAATPDDGGTRTARGQLRQSLGDATGAEADLRAVLRANPKNATAARALAYGTRLAPDDPAVTAMREAVVRPDLSDADRRLLGYALARALQSTEPEVASEHLATANASMLRAYPYDRGQMRARFVECAERLWPALKASGAQGASGPAPIFVTGLPRSGTTLVEAVLSAHPSVVAGGELAVLRRAVAPLVEAVGAGAPVEAGMLSEAGNAYAAAAERAAPGTAGERRRTDKSIFSFLDVGLIRAILPNAAIVAVHRDPRDTGLSIWRNHFRDGLHRYAATQEGIADAVELWRDATAFWEAELPGVVHHLRYEDLLDDPEGQARGLLAACGLEWDPGVLSFHERAGRVDTLSFAQVRQPLYTSSRGGWRRHAEEIAPLIAALGARGLLPDD